MFDVTQISRDAISRADLLNKGESAGITEKQESGGFADILDAAITGARTDERQAADMAERFANGDPAVGMHEAVIAAEKASISVRYAVNLKNKLLESYRELMNTPL